jgi:hypothetical protein
VAINKPPFELSFAIGIMEYWNVEDPAWRGWNNGFWKNVAMVYWENFL